MSLSDADHPHVIEPKPTPTPTPTPESINVPRRDFGKTLAMTASAMALGGFLPQAQVWAAGSDRPEKAKVQVGFIPLTDCASVVVAAQLGFDKKYGIEIVPSKEASWAGVRDKLVNGELDAAHVLYGLVYGVHLGIGGLKQDMAVLMNLNHNGQAITLSSQLHSQGVRDGETLARHIKAHPRDYTFAQTFPTGTHAMWLYYYLASIGIHPFKDVKTIVVPPPQMVANMRVGNMDGFCVGEPWNARAIFDKIGFTVSTSQAIWADHPEKVLGCTAAFVKRYPNASRALTAALLDASRFIDDPRNRSTVAKLISGKSYVNAPVEVIESRFLGHYDNGIGQRWQDPHHMKFFGDGQVTFPYLSDGMWFLTQHKRWGLLSGEPDYQAVAAQINQIGLYKEAATAAKVGLPSAVMRRSTLLDGKIWDGSEPARYAASFSLSNSGATA